MKVCKKSAFPLTAIMVAVTAFLQVIGESYAAVNSWNRLFENPAQSMVRFLIVFLFRRPLLRFAHRHGNRRAFERGLKSFVFSHGGKDKFLLPFDIVG